MNSIWRWDQGRLNYFQYTNLQLIAKALLHLDSYFLNMKDLDTENFVGSRIGAFANVSR
ncbi:MAG: hypothetical protein RIS64_943 [Bacteroidota bacterium]|jgi:hypothetical protein